MTFNVRIDVSLISKMTIDSVHVRYEQTCNSLSLIGLYNDSVTLSFQRLRLRRTALVAVHVLILIAHHHLSLF